MKLVSRRKAMAALAARWRREGLSVGFVPTMGALHEGHLSLMRRARRSCDRVVVSIFVNPAQFGPNEDYSRYPRTLAADRRLCAEAGADALYNPDAAEVYPNGLRTTVEVAGLSDRLCGAFRPGHFKGVATVVLKLFETVRPHRAYFGEKDYQQLVIVKTMARDLDLGVSVVGCPTVREPDGLARSSRNRYLSPEERARAARLFEALGAGKAAAEARRGAPADAEAAARRVLADLPGARVEYVSLVDAETLAPAAALRGRLRLLAAIRIGSTRLIDNVPVSC